MASTAAKKTVARNKIVLRNLLIGEAVAFSISLLLCLAKSASCVRLLLITVPEALIVFVLYRISRPAYAADNSKRLEDGGSSLDGHGIVSLCFDFLYLSWAIKVLSVWTSWAYLLYLIMILSAFYEFVPRLLRLLFPSREFKGR